MRCSNNMVAIYLQLVGKKHILNNQSHLPNECGFSTHVRPGNDLEPTFPPDLI